MSSLPMMSGATSLRAFTRPASAPDWARHWDCAYDEPIGDRPSDNGFVTLLAACRATGGIARASDLAGMLADRHRGDFSCLARLIASGAAFGFEWHDMFWVPMFQFEPADLSVRLVQRRVLAELAPEFDGWLLATWFARRNAGLDDRRPLDMLDSDLAGVVRAARADGRAARESAGRSALAPGVL